MNPRLAAVNTYLDLPAAQPKSRAAVNNGRCRALEAPEVASAIDLVSGGWE